MLTVFQHCSGVFCTHFRCTGTSRLIQKSNTKFFPIEWMSNQARRLTHMRDLYVISVWLQINQEFGLSTFGLSGRYLYFLHLGQITSVFLDAEWKLQRRSRRIDRGHTEDISSRGANRPWSEGLLRHPRGFQRSSVSELLFCSCVCVVFCSCATASWQIYRYFVTRKVLRPILLLGIDADNLLLWKIVFGSFQTLVDADTFDVDPDGLHYVDSPPPGPSHR